MVLSTLSAFEDIERISHLRGYDEVADTVINQSRSRSSRQPPRETLPFTFTFAFLQKLQLKKLSLRG